MTAALALQLIAALLADMPALITDIENLIKQFKGQSTAPAQVTPTVVEGDADLVKRLGAV